MHSESLCKHTAPAPTVLLVDDEPINIRILQSFLHSSGFQSLAAMSGPKARELARIHHPDIILLDIMMPPENGFETCRLLKASPITADIPIIFISALSEVKIKVQAFELGAVDYITKPFEKSEILARVRVHLKLKMALKSLMEEQAAKLRQISEAQESMLVRPKDMPEAKFAIRYVPVLEAGGDFYDVFHVGAGTHSYFVADISGHDLGACFVTSCLKGLLQQNSGPLYTQLETLMNINTVLEQILPDGKYLTAQSCQVDRGRMIISVINAGHPPPLYVPKDGPPRYLEAEGDVLGAFESIFLESLTLEASLGDRLYLYTDGLTEAFGIEANSQIRGQEKLIHSIDSFRGLPLEESLDSILNIMLPLNRIQEDDVVLMAIEV